jgi:hypothetical protein
MGWTPLRRSAYSARVLSPDEVARARERLAAILRAHELDWVVRRVDDALDEGRQPESGAIDDLQLRRLVMLIEAAQRALAMTTRLEREVPQLLLRETGGRRVHIEPDRESGGDPRLHPPIIIERDTPQRAEREFATERTLGLLSRLLNEARETP